MKNSIRLAFRLTTIAVFVQIFSPAFGSETDPIGGILGPGSHVPASLEKILSAGLPGRVEQVLTVKNISPLYAEPKMPNEGVWIKEDLSGGHDAVPLVYRTFYRPSDNFPNSIVYMMLLNMKRISPRLYLGAAEQYRKGFRLVHRTGRSLQATGGYQRSLANQTRRQRWNNPERTGPEENGARVLRQ